MKNEAIEMIKMPLSVVRVAAFCLPLALVTSCGSSKPEAVQGTTINILPAKWSQSTTLGTSDVNFQHVTISAKSISGYPQIGVQLLIDSHYLVYDGHPTSLAGLTPLTLPYIATTSPNGTYDVTVLYDWPNAISGDVTAIESWSGTAYGNAIVTYTCVDPISTDATVCP
jgi:hypothetical protein